MARGAWLGTVLTDWGVFVSVATAGGILALTWWLLFGRPPERTRPGDEPRPTTVLCCSECGDRIAYNATLEGSVCEACEAGGVYVAQTDTGATGGRPWGKITVLGLVSVIAVSALTLSLARRIGVLQKWAEAERNRPLVVPCPHCGRKIAYPASGAGTVFVCWRCKTAFVLPAEDGEVHDEADGESPSD